MLNKIIVPIDGSEHAFKALDVATDVIDKAHGTLCLLHVVPSGSMPEGLEQWAAIEHVVESPAWLYDQAVGQNMLETARRRARDKACERLEDVVAHGDPANEILKSARSMNADAIVMGTRGLSTLKRLVIGSVAQKVLHHAECTVIVVH
ncbi:MAG: universal stress protein [Gammaproteobacteria bacterium]